VAVSFGYLDLKYNMHSSFL